MNGNFEAGLDPWYMNRWNSAYMLELQATDRGMSALTRDRVENWNGVQQTLALADIQKGTYRLSCYGKIESGTSSDNLQLTLRIETAENPNGPHTYVGWQTTTLINSSDWTLVEGTVSTVVDGTISKVAIYAQAATVATNYWVDEVSMVLISAQQTSGPSVSPSASPTSSPINPTGSPSSSVSILMYFTSLD